jgi:hypothetical protein
VDVMSEMEHLGVEVATGGRPMERVDEAIRRLPGGPRGWLLDVHHDDGCPATRNGNLQDCDCEILLLFAHGLKP